MCTATSQAPSFSIIPSLNLDIAECDIPDCFPCLISSFLNIIHPSSSLFLFQYGQDNILFT